MSEAACYLGKSLEEVAERWSGLTPLMVQMGIIDDLLHRRIVLEVRGDESYTLHISREGMRLEKGRDPWAQAVMRTTLEEWRRVFQGEGTFCAIFRMEPEPCRDPVRLHQLAVV